MPTRIGLVADTHCPEFLPRLPAQLFQALRGVDLILHAGDISAMETLSELAEIAPVQAVRGDHDRAVKGLPPTLEIEVEGQRIAVVHGNRSRLIEEPVTFIGTITLGRFWPAPALHEYLHRRFPAADVVVYGHTHAAICAREAGTLFVNPGAVYQVTPAEARRRLGRHPNWFEWTWLQVIRHRRRVASPSVAILEVAPSGVACRLIPL